MNKSKSDFNDKSQVMSAYHSCALSFSAKNEEFSRKLSTDLKESGIDCWYAPQDMGIGEEIRPRIKSVIYSQDKLITILSEESIASGWVKYEVKCAREKKQRTGQLVLLPLRIDDAIFDCTEEWANMLRRERNIGDFTEWENESVYFEKFKQLIKDLRRGV